MITLILSFFGLLFLVTVAFVGGLAFGYLRMLRTLLHKGFDMESIYDALDLSESSRQFIEES